MASSRWKRFAFFERHQLNLNTDVLEDILPNEGEIAVNRTSLQSHSISLVATTASLTFDSKALPRQNDLVPLDATSAMWASLTACTSPDAANESEQESIIFRRSEPISSKAAKSSSALDGLVLAFVTSSYTDLVHCFDITLRCNPPHSFGRDLDNMDGWRGYFTPFAKAHHVSSSHEAMEDVPVENVVAVACCRSESGHHPVMVACISKNNVKLWEDPHLHLSCRRPIKAPQASNESKIFSLQNGWNTGDGDCLSVDILPSLLAVGTTSGVVLLYAIKATGRLLRSYLRIPAPPTGVNAAVSVKLHAEDENKALIFVAYRRSSDAHSQASSGVCCYEFPLPSPTSSSMISAPSARHDLDGRPVGSASQVDSFPTPSGLHFMVVSPLQYMFLECFLVGLTHSCFIRPVLTDFTHIQKQKGLGSLLSTVQSYHYP